MNIYAVIFLTIWTAYTSLEHKVRFVIHLIENNWDLLLFDDFKFIIGITL